jgi:predicted HicB family RNase H-like nuclease
MVDDKDTLHKEIQSWDKFKYALRKENAMSFDQMLKECLEEGKEGRQVQFANAMNARGENFAAESLFMVLILQQERMINQLISKLSSMKNVVKQKD